MLPKVATTILHTSSRAASAVQNQSYAIKNIFQLQSNSGPNANRGSNGPSSGGPRYHAGSRSYYSSGRAVSQGGLYEANDGSVFQTDDSDDVSPNQQLTRVRRATSSFTLGERLEQRRRRPLGVLNAVQLHARSRHAFATIEPARTLSRRNSMSVVDTPSMDSIPVDILPSHPQSPPLPSVQIPTSNSSLQTPASRPLAAERLPSQFLRLLKAKDLDAGAATALVMDFRNNATDPTVPDFNAALEALYSTRPAGEPITLILETYNDMVARGLVPNFRTYTALILALTDRDNEVLWAISAIEQRQQWSKMGVSSADSASEQDKDQLRLFKEENNIASAILLFRALTAAKAEERPKIPSIIFRNLLRSCAKHAHEPGMVDAAINVWSQMEQTCSGSPSVGAFQWMIHLYGNIGDLAGAQEVFKEFRRASEANRIQYSSNDELNIRLQAMIWNEMVEGCFKCGQPHLGVALLDEMLDAAANQQPDEERKVRDGVYLPTFDINSPPPASPDSFYAVVAGFVAHGDVDSAWTWFQKLIGLPTSSIDIGRNQPTLTPMRPNSSVWRVMVEALAREGHSDRLVELLAKAETYKVSDGIELRSVDLNYIFAGVVERLHKLDAKNVTTFDQIKPYWDALKTLREVYSFTPFGGVSAWHEIAQWAVRHGFVMEGVTLGEEILRDTSATFNQKMDNRSHLVKLTSDVYSHHRGDVPFRAALILGRLAERERYTYPIDFTTYLLQSYSKESPENLSTLEVADWVMMMNAALCIEVMPASVPLSFCADYSFKGAFSLLQDLASQKGTEFSPIDVVIKSSPKTLANVLSTIYSKEGEENIRAWLTQIGKPTLFDDLLTKSDSASEVASDYDTPATSPTLSSPEVERWDLLHGQELQELVDLSWWNGSPDIAYKFFCAAAAQHKVPTFTVANRLIKMFERAKQLDRAEFVFETMHHKQPARVLSNSHQWLSMLDTMLVCYAHNGNIERAHALRAAILDSGSAPSADAYGALIYYINETTDDASNALALYHESKLRGVPGSPYLYNNIISKVAKARKADLALELFTAMKEEGIQTSSITYGAVIGACVRVGDALSAENLFSEMTAQSNFQARVPPYNTMIQLYTTTKPNKERALYYYEQLIASGVKPTSYTYKLLIDAYMLEPVNVEKAEAVFESVSQQRKGRMAVTLEGQHVAAMINAYGCVRKDLTKAQKFFETAIKYLPNGYDAVVFEAMFNVIMVHKQPDLIDVYLRKMEEARVHMTAYVVNVVIRAFAVAGDIEQAREIFESLLDPPQGMAAMYNHAPHGSTSQKNVDANAPVYREPSTWEAMIRAELGQGHRERALALLERLKERQYPDAVYNRISGILVDHSVLPPEFSI